MFNILLMVAGVLEYVLLGIDFRVSTFFFMTGQNLSTLSIHRAISQIHTSVES